MAAAAAQGDQNNFQRKVDRPKKKEEEGTWSNYSVPPTVYDCVRKVDYVVGKFLGQGGFASVYEGKDKKSGNTVALKVIDSNLLKDGSTYDQVVVESALQYSCNHANIVKVNSAFETEHFLFISMELCSAGSISAIVKEKGPFDETKARHYIRQLLLGVQYMHDEKKILHRDLKLGNMLLTPDDTLKIADFGLAMNMAENHSGICGTPNYLAPETIRKERHTISMDIWSIGISLYAMLFGRPPFEMHSIESTQLAITSGEFEFPTHRAHIGSDARDLIRALLHKDAEQRPSIAQILVHPFVSPPPAPELPLATASASNSTASASTSATAACSGDTPKREPNVKVYVKVDQYIHACKTKSRILYDIPPEEQAAFDAGLTDIMVGIFKGYGSRKSG